MPNEPPRPAGFHPLGSPAPEPWPGEPSLRESVRLDCVAPDAAGALLVRLERYPEVGRAWLWVALCVDGAVYAYHDALRDRGAPVEFHAETARYELQDGTTLALGRLGPPDAVTDVAARLDVMAHEDAHPPAGDGRVLLSIDAVFHASGAPPGSQGDLLEVTGDAEAAVVVGDREVYVGGRASWRERRQHHRPWVGPAAAVRLRGPDATLVDDAGGPAGRIVRLRETREVDEVSVAEDRDGGRALLVRLVDGTELDGTLETACAWSLPLAGGRRRVSVVRGVLDGMPLTGMVEDGDELL